MTPTALPPGALVVVAGATGYLGSHVAFALAQAGYRVRALVRDPARLGALRPHLHEVFVGQATDSRSLQGLCDGAAAVFTSIGVRQVSRRPTYWEVDRDANLALAQEALRAGVSRFVFTSVFGGRARRGDLDLFEAKEQVVDFLEASALVTTTIRPTGLFNDMSEYFEMAKSGRVWIFGAGTAEVNPVHAADVADHVVQVLAAARPPADVELGGPETFSMAQIGKVAFDTLDRAPRYGRLPLWLLSLAAAALRPVNLNLSGLLAFFRIINAEGAVAPSVSGRRLSDFFGELATRGSEALRPVAAEATR